MTKCARCDTPLHPLEVFPKNLCVECHAKEATLPQTAEELARMWGGK